MAERITVYTTGPSCARCTLTTKVLANKGIAYDEVNIRDNEDARAYVVEDHWSGFRPDHIDRIAKNR